MKKKFRFILGLFAAATVAFTTVSSSFAAEESVSLSGTIGEQDLKISVNLPSSGNLTLKPYGTPQISSPTNFFANTTSGDDAVSYDVTLAGYTVTAVSKTAANVITLKTADTAMGSYTGTKKEICVHIKIGKVFAGADGDGDAEFKTSIKEPKVDFLATKKSDKDYTPAGTVAYTKVTASDSTKATLAAGEKAAFAVEGTMNPNAEWEAGDKITVTPVFSIVPTA